MNLRITLPLALIVASAAMTGCSNKSMTPKQAGEIEILEYCAGDEYKSDKNHFRASATGQSMSRETAKKMARSNAEAKLARSINATIEIVTDKEDQFLRLLVNLMVLKRELIICCQLQKKNWLTLMLLKVIILKVI